MARDRSDADVSLTLVGDYFAVEATAAVGSLTMKDEQGRVSDCLEPRIRILLGSSIAIGPGKAALLEAIGETGSIAAAGRRMGMSYHERLFPGAAD